ncbi:MAG: restriction endonuclease [Gammaproteobacteria bacterium]|nr:restriction endonuclease [Gammaproteobacteria bacterium]MCP5137943.1 restriction endonuclease [Gammaproteobacteria bacterium]
MPNVYCVRANNGQYADLFLKHGYTAIGWFEGTDLGGMRNRDDIHSAYSQKYPDDNRYVTGQQVGQIARFLFDIQPGDYVLLPPTNSEFIHWGIIEDAPYFHADGSDGCPFEHRREVKWHKTPVPRTTFSVPFQNSIRSSLTVFLVDHANEFFAAIGKTALVQPDARAAEVDLNAKVIDRLLQLDATEFEILVTRLLRALGFESEHTGKVGDGGVDATGDLDVSGMAKIKIYVQVKRYKPGSAINDRTVKALRQNIPAGAQGAFITTSSFTKEARKTAVEPGFPRIGTIDGAQLVDLLAAQWDKLDLESEIAGKLGLRVGLIPS